MPDLKLNTTGVDLSVFNTQPTELNTEGVDLSVFETVKKKEEPVSFGGSESLASPSAATENKQPLTYMQQELRNNGLITDNLVESKQIGDVLKKAPLSFLFPHADEKFLNKSRNPLDVQGKAVDVETTKEKLPEQDNEDIAQYIKPKQDPSYFWGTVKAINTGTSSFFNTLDNAARTTADFLGLQQHDDGLFRVISDKVAQTAEQMPDVPDNRAGRLLRNVGGLEGMFLELAITPEFKIAKVGTVPKLITQMTGAGFVNSYANAVNKNADVSTKAIEGLKGAGVGLKDAGVLVALGYGSAIAGGSVGKAVGSELAGSVASTLTNAVGFAGSDAVQQLIETGNIDKNQLEQSFDIGLALGIPEIARNIGTRAMTNYFTASPNVEKQSIKNNVDVETLREQAINTRKEAETLDPEARAAEEAKANVIDGVADVKVISEEVAKDPEKFKQSIKEDETLTPDQKQVYTQKIDDTVELQKQQQKEEPAAPIVSEAKVEETKKQEPVVEGAKPSEIKPIETVSATVDIPIAKEVTVVTPDTKEGLKPPKPSKPIEQMSSEEIRSFSDEIKQHEKNIYSDVFGEQADKFKQLEQSSNNPTKTKEQLKAIDAEMQQMVDALPKEKRDIWESDAEYDATELRDMSRMVGLVEESENINELSSSLKNPLMTFSKNRNNKQTLAIFNAAIKKAQELGVSTEELIGKTSKLIAKEFKDPQDAMDVVKSALEAISQPTVAEQKQIQQKQPIVGEQQIEQPQLNLTQNGKESSKSSDEAKRRQQETLLVESRAKLEREVKKEENKARLGRIFDNAAKLTGARLDITSEEKRTIRKELARDVVDYVKTEFDLLGEALVEKVKSFVKDNNIPLEDISDQELNDVLKEQGYAKGNGNVAEKGGEQAQKLVEGEKGRLHLRDNEKNRMEAGEGEKVRQQGSKIINSTSLPEDIKTDFEKEGIGYLPRGRKVTREESTQIAQAKLQMEGGREQLKKDILDPTNNIKGDTRIALAVEFVKDAKNTLLKATSQKEIDKARADITDVLTYTMNRSTDVAQELEANKMITELLGSDPEFIEDVYRNDINKKNEPFYQAQKENIKSAQEIITEYLNSEEFKNKYKVKLPRQGEEKLTTKQLRDRGINKIASATSKLADLIGAKKNFTQEEMGKGTDLFNILKELGDGILDVGVASTKELMDKIKSNTRKYFKPSEIDQISKVLIDELKAEERLKAKPTRAITLDAKDEKILVDRLYSKVINANEKQLKQLLADNVDLLVREGSINDEAFKELFAKAMGKDFVDQKAIDKLKASAQLVQDLKVIESDLEKMFNHAIEAELNGVPKAEIDAIKKQIKEKLKEHTDALHNAEKAAKVIGETLAGKGDIAEKVGAVIKGNLITPASQVVNIIGNYSMLPVRSTKNVIATSLDILLSGVGYLNEKAIAKVNEKEIAYINKESERLGIPKEKVNVPISFAKTKRALAKLPSFKRTRTGFGLSKQRLIGEGKGYVQGIKQLWTGSLPTDLQRVELRSGLHPLDAMINNYNMLSGKEKLEFKKFAENFYESTIGVAPEVTFRLLNLFDKPVRIGAERDKLNQLADLKNLKGAVREKFLEMPDLESAEIARKAGDEATFQQDTWLSKWSSGLDQKMLKAAKETTNPMLKAAYYTGYYAKNMVVPFVKTPINVEMELLGYAVPEVALARGLVAMYKGDRQGFTENMGKAIVGSYMLKGIGYLFGAGIMTLASGGHEDDSDQFITPKIKSAEYRDKPAYYINIDAWQRDIHNKIYGTKLSLDWQEGDQISSYRRMGIVSAMAMAQAEAYRGKSKEEIKNLNFWQTAHTSIPALVKSGAEQTFVSGTSSLINVFIGTEYERDNFFLGLSKAAGASVLPNAVKTYIMANDNLIRETKDATKKGVDAIKSKIITDFKASLTTGSNIPTKITIWGERVNRYEDGSSPAFQLFDITKTKIYKSDFGAKIFELYEKISADKELSKEIPPKSVLPPVLGSSLKYKDEEIKLDPKTYEDMQIYVGTKLKEKTWASLSSMDWDSASDKRKFEKLKHLYVGDRSYRNKLIDRYVSSHKDILDELWLKQYGSEK